MPVFARRLGEFGDGVTELGYMTMAFALAQLIGAPLWGGFADRRGRRPIILFALTAVTLAYIGYLIAHDTWVIITIRAMAGFMTAGLFPAAMGVVADIVSEKDRARWVGIVMGSYAIGMIFGPALGGFLYDGWGYSAPFTLSAVVAFMALLAAFFMIPETRPPAVRKRQLLRARRAAPHKQNTKQSLWAVLPRPLHLIGALLFIDFVGSFGFAFVEPQMVFYFYDTLEWTTVQFGVVVGAYGIVMVLGQMFLGQLSDKWGR
ncbi:MAG: MFS transporter, partial [Alphaproteobacteria bacterium]|nr:MFS transporter [Alphaproteobacteria bacterium]